jgi:transposase
VNVAVGQARDHGASAEVDHSGVVTGEPLHGRRRAGRDDPVARNRDGLVDGEVLVHGDDLAVEQHGVGGLCGSGGGEEEGGEEGEGGAHVYSFFILSHPRHCEERSDGPVIFWVQSYDLIGRMDSKHVMDIRIRQAERRQAGFELVDLESLVVDDHPVRAVWSFVEGLDLQVFYDRIKVRGETPGRPATDPRILLALWLYATADGVGSARALARLCEHHTIYRWICGGVGVNHTMLSEFRLDSGEFLDRLLTSSLAALMKEGLITLEEVITDGTKVRAAASRSSMRRRQTLGELEEKARTRVAELKQELEADSAAGERRLSKRRLSAAEDRARRVAAALAKHPAPRRRKRRTRVAGTSLPAVKTARIPSKSVSRPPIRMHL